jgi:hypothetical protein
VSSIERGERGLTNVSRLLPPAVRAVGAAVVEHRFEHRSPLPTPRTKTLELLRSNKEPTLPKKNRDDELRLVLPDRDARMSLGGRANDAEFAQICADYLPNELAAPAGTSSTLP